MDVVDGLDHLTIQHARSAASRILIFDCARQSKTVGLHGKRNMLGLCSFCAPKTPLVDDSMGYTTQDIWDYHHP
jgi:hypothetical protein